MSEKKTNIKKTSTFKISVELQAKETTDLTVIPELSQFSEEELMAELERRYGKNDYSLRIHITEYFTVISTSGKFRLLVLSLAKAGVENPKLLSLLASAVKCATPPKAINN